MSQVKIAEEAEADLVEIWVFIAQDNVEAADQFLERIYDTCQALARSPSMGRERSDLARGVRSFPVGTYLIFYRRARRGIEVARVLSGFRDLPPLFRPR
jgi:toxin ParE1/3/4